MFSTRSRWVLAFPAVFLLLLTGCGSKSTDPEPAPPPPPVIPGSPSTFELMTWNIEWFAKDGQATIDMVVDIIDSLQVDLIAVQEIADTTDFRTLIRALDGYQGLYSPDTYGDTYQKTGILYKESVVSIGSYFPIFTGDDDWYAFPRPPMKFHVTAGKNGREFDFRLIVLHLKAFGDSASTNRRRAAVQELKDYLDERQEYDEEKDYIVAGDWNDSLSDPPWSNIFMPLQQSPDYRFVTASLVSSSWNISHPGVGSLIDHILISSDVEPEYYPGHVYTQRLDDVWPDYIDIVSDHRPVMAIFPVF